MAPASPDLGRGTVLLRKDTETRSHTDGFGENNAKCLKPKGICGFVPDSSIYGF